MTPPKQCDPDMIPRPCADKFETILGKLTKIETALAGRQVWVGRAWNVFKGVLLIVVGFLVGKGRS